MTPDEAIERYAVIPEDRKGQFLIRLSWWLTVSLRGCYSEADDALKALKLQGANEIQHQLASEAGHYLTGNIERCSDDVLIRICVEKALHYKIAGELGGVMKTAL